MGHLLRAHVTLLKNQRDKTSGLMALFKNLPTEIRSGHRWSRISANIGILISLMSHLRSFNHLYKLVVWTPYIN